MRTRLARVLEEHSEYGEVTTETVRALAEKASLSYSTLARYLLYEPPNRTESLRRSSVVAVARALDLNPNWLRDGQGSRQLGLWPVAVSDVEPDDDVEPLAELRRSLLCLEDLPKELQLRASRAALSAILETVVENDGELRGELYEALVKVDAAHRGIRSEMGTAG